jgi:hypothetical protein
MNTTRNWIVLALGLLGAPWALSQEAPLRLESFGGTRVPAHYVRLEGAGSQVGYSILKLHQQMCERQGKPVEIPAEAEPISRITREDYYTPTHLIEYKRTQIFFITRDCTTEWKEIGPQLRIHSPYGVCSLKLLQKTAKGRCDGSTSGSMIPLPQRSQEVLGTDLTRNCIRTAAEIFGLRSVHCVEPQAQPWRSFLYRAGAYRRGILLTDRGTHVPNGTLVTDIEAVEIRKNTTIGSDVLTLARTLGFRITSTAPDAE